MTALEFIIKWGIRQDTIASKMGISAQLYTNKIKGRNKWKDADTEALTKVLNDLAKDISKIK